MHESNWAWLWRAVNWVTQLVIVSDHQTNSHSYVCALAPFSSGAVPQRPLKPKELTGRGFKPISSLGNSAHQPWGEKEKTTPGVRLNLKDGFIYVGCTSGFFFFFSGGERRVTVKNSHQLACHFSVVFCLSLGLGETSAHLVSVVKPISEAHLFWETQQISFSVGHLGRSPGRRPEPYASKCNVGFG